MKKRVSVFVMLLAAVLMLLQNCMPDKEKHPINVLAHRPIELAAFKKLSRTDQVKKCASCHRQQYEQEMRGPHKAAFNNYYEHLVYVWSQEYDVEPYRAFLNDRKTKCAGCHAGENIFEKTYGHDMLQHTGLSDSLKMLLGSGPQCRSADNTDLDNGIDCLTCHYDGNRVVTNSTFTSKGTLASPAYCSPQASALFSSNNNCLTCHYEEAEVTAMQTMLTDEKGKSCVKCHQQYDASGKGTHYYYWRNDSTDKPKPPRLQLFDGIEATYNPATATVEVKWYNRIMPHLLTRATQTTAVLEVTDAAGTVMGQGKILLNRREEHKVELSPYFGAGKEPGTSGRQLSLDGTPLVQLIKNIRPPKGSALYLHITGYQKAQYWFPDSFDKKIYERTVSISNPQIL